VHDVTHYGWLPAGVQPDATTVPGHRRPDEYVEVDGETVVVRRGQPVFWAADRDLDEALAAKLGSKLTAIEVYANHGRWVVECPTCHGAQLAVRTDPRFMCVNCGNASVGGVWRPVIWPKDHPEIEAILDARPMPHTRNWAPGETVKDLRREEPQDEPTDPREHAIWAGLSEEAADEWVRELKKRKKAS
jgi:hypothetical protein